MNDHPHTSNNGPETPYISTQNLASATNHVDTLIEAIREAHHNGTDLNVEELTILSLTAVIASDVEDRSVIAQQALMLSIALQRLAS